MPGLKGILNQGLRNGGGSNVQFVLSKEFDTSPYGYEGGQGAIGDVLSKALGKYITSKSFGLMCEVADEAADIISANRKSFNYMDVTGNLTESMGVAVIGNTKRRETLSVGRYYSPSKRMANASVSRIKHTRSSLGYNEVYDLLRYADGSPVERKPYRGESDLGAHTYGSQQREAFLKELRAMSATKPKNNLYTVYAFVSMPYAGYVERKNQFDFAYLFASMLRDSYNEVSMWK